jgi:DUF1009 family protein
VGRALGLMCGAGVLPARMAAHASRQGWRVVAFTFGDAPGPGLGDVVDRVVPSRLADLATVLVTLTMEKVSAALFAGKFSLGEVLRERSSDDVGRAIADHAGTLTERRLTDAVVATLATLGIEVLDQRPFHGDWLQDAGCWTKRVPSPDQWADVHCGLAVARQCADLGVGQTVVVKRGVVAAVEALEGTTEALRRGGVLAGPGAVMAKAVARDNDYRFDTPGIGPDTVAAAAETGVAVLAVEARRVMLFERDAMIAAADRADIALVGASDGDAGG